MTTWTRCLGNTNNAGVSHYIDLETWLGWPVSQDGFCDPF
jgi:hypothetical protein